MPANPPRFGGTNRARLFARDCGAAAHGIPTSSARLLAMVGVAEVHDDAGWRRERIHDFALLGQSRRAFLSFEGEGRALPDHAPATDLGSLVCDIQGRSPDRTMASLGWGGGAMVLRDTRAPSAPGTALCQILIIASAPEGLVPDASMVSLAVHSRSDGSRRPASGSIDVEGPCESFEHRGASIDQVLKAPIWGWGDEPHGFASAMRLDVVDACTRLQELFVAEDGDPEEIARLQRATMNAVQNNSDPVYATFRRRMARDGHMLPWDAAPTASECLTRSQALGILVAELLKAA
jgi:hypothetical protein